MKKLFMFFALVISINSHAADKTKPGKMPREKALIVRNADLEQANLNLQIERIQKEIDKLQEGVKASIAERDVILKEFNIEPADYAHTVYVDAKTGEIKRSSPSQPTTTKQ